MPHSLDPGFLTELRVLSFLATVGEFTLIFQAVTAYLLPTYIALARQLPDRRHIITCNLAWGWTVIGWIRALVLATGQPTGQPLSEPIDRHGGPSEAGRYAAHATAPDFHEPGGPNHHPRGRTSAGSPEHDNGR